MEWHASTRRILWLALKALLLLFPRIAACQPEIAPSANSPSEPWLTPYSGPSRNDISTMTLDGKVLCGYQGWFNTPGDGAQLGFRHWCSGRSEIVPSKNQTASNLTIDYWPDVSEYDVSDLHQTTMTHPNGAFASLYSAYRRGPVLKHFQWMRQYGIDGVFLSRFVSETKNPATFRHVNMVLNHVREGAHLEGRTWALMYDTSGSKSTESLIADWKFMCDQVKIRQDSRYLHHAGKPVVMVWGFGFKDRPFTDIEAAAVIDFFKNDPVYGGVYLIGGVDPGWRTLTASSKTDPGWSAVYRSFDAISPWDVGRYGDVSQLPAYKARVWSPDLAELSALSKGYMPVVFPGFSWDNLQNLKPGTSTIPRKGGDFYWKQFYHLKTAGVQTVFVAMFDEMDEGTQIFKISNEPPAHNAFRTYEGMPSDWYLKLTGAATQMQRNVIATTDTLPRSFSFAN